MQDQSNHDRDYDAFRKTQIVDAVERLIAQTVSQGAGFQHYGATYEQMTVKAICDEAGISRPTFYHYFKDKFEVAQWFWDLAGERYLRECGRSLGWYESNLGMLRTFRDHAVFYAAVTAGDGDRNACINHGYRRRVTYLLEAITDFCPALLTDDLRFQIDFFTDAESRAISTWAKGGMLQAPERLARKIELCVPRELHDLVEMSYRRFS